MMNFGSNFINYCKTLYAGSFSRVLVNGHQSDKVDVQTGVRQGCPIAALLYLMACERMASLFRSDSNFKGFSIQTPDMLVRLCISQYCDDTLLFCRDLADIARAEHILQLYETASGQKINYSKSPALYVKLTPPPNSRFATLEDDESQRVLGLNVGQAVVP